MYIIQEERLNTLAETVESKVYKIGMWVTQNILRESFNRKHLQHDVLTTVFEVLQENPKMQDEDIITEAVKRFKRFYLGAQSACYDKRRRETPSISRAKAFEGIFEFIGDIPAHSQDKLDDELLTIYEYIASVCGHELAVIYVLHIGYGISVRNITVKLFGVNENSPAAFYKQRQRIYRVIQYAGKMLEENVHVSREGREVLNIER